jgi:hypothetical protein
VGQQRIGSNNYEINWKIEILYRGRSVSSGTIGSGSGALGVSSSSSKSAKKSEEIFFAPTPFLLAVVAAIFSQDKD